MAERKANLDKFKLESGWRETTMWTLDQGSLSPSPWHMANQDPTDLLLARLDHLAQAFELFVREVDVLDEHARARVHVRSGSPLERASQGVKRGERARSLGSRWYRRPS